MSKEIRPYRLLVVAHPDDETLFFSAALLKQRKIPWKIVCVTRENADGTAELRSKQFASACKKLKVKDFEQLDFPDFYERRLNVEALMHFLKSLPKPVEVYTHGVTGEYGHPHHQDVSYAVHKVFSKKIKVWIPAYNTFAEKSFSLSANDYKIKSEIYDKIYAGETLRFSSYLPNRTTDEFTRLSLEEVEEIYQSIIQKRIPNKKKLKKYGWFFNFLADENLKDKKRPF